MTDIHIFDHRSPIHVLGPFTRAVIWVQGCPFACQGCIVPESWDVAGGIAITASDLADWVLAQPNIEGLTVSGGEPMQQAKALVELIDRLQLERDLGVVCYTGYRLEFLLQNGTAAQRTLLKRIDLLIDGRYIPSQHGNLLWRGSSNQRLVCLSDRYRTVLSQLPDCSVGVEVAVSADGSIDFTGVPAIPDFRNEFESRLRQSGVLI
jgi:anaerobic ribonucleoside-triphosphate reductase activating protein